MRLLRAGTQLSDRLLQVRINGDVALLKGIIKRCSRLRIVRRAQCWTGISFRDHTHGFEEFREHVRTADWRQIEEQSGIASGADR